MRLTRKIQLRHNHHSDKEKGGRDVPYFKVLIYMGKEIPGKDWATGGSFLIVGIKIPSLSV